MKEREQGELEGTETRTARDRERLHREAQRGRLAEARPGTRRRDTPGQPALSCPSACCWLFWSVGGDPAGGRNAVWGFASPAKPARGQRPQTDQATSCSAQRRAHRRVGPAFTRRAQGQADTHPQTLRTTRSPRVSTPLFLAPPGELESPPPCLTFAPTPQPLETPGATQERREQLLGEQDEKLQGGAGGKEGRDGAWPLHARCHVRQVGGGGRVTRLWRGCLGLGCLPAGRVSGRGWEPLPLQPGPCPAGLLGNQESQAQLIKRGAAGEE